MICQVSQGFRRCAKTSAVVGYLLPGSPMADAMVNPAQTFADMAAGRVPGKEEEQPQPGQISQPPR